MSPEIFAPPFSGTVTFLVESFKGHERSGVAHLRDAADKLDGIIRERVTSDLRALGRSHEEIEAFLSGQRVPAEPPKPRQRQAKSLPDAPPDDAAFLLLLLDALTGCRASAKGLAAGFRGANIDRVRRLLADEASRGVLARVKLEPNGRTWVRVEPGKVTP